MEERDDRQLDFPKALLLFLLTYSWFTMLCPSLLHRDSENKQTKESSRKRKEFIYIYNWITLLCLCFIEYTKAFDCVDHNKLWKILQEMGILDHLTCLLRNVYVGQEVTVRTGHVTTDWFQIRKGARQGCILSPCLFNLYVEYIMRNAGLEEAQAGIKIAGRISITSDMQMTPPFWQKVKKN